MIALIWLAVAFAQEPVSATTPEAAAPVSEESPAPPDDIIVELGAGLEVNWTRMVLSVRSTARSHGAEDTRAVEELARREIAVGMDQAAARVPMSDGRTLGDLFGEPEIGEALQFRIPRWEVVEATYFGSGRVELVAELSLQELLKPWSIAHARSAEPAEREPRYTGLVVDARGTGASPAWAARILAHDGEPLYDGTLWEQEAVTLVPVVFASDPGHAAVARAGASPMTVQAAEGRAGDLVLTSEDSVRFRTSMAGAQVLGEGTVVVLLDP